MSPGSYFSSKCILFKTAALCSGINVITPKVPFACDDSTSLILVIKPHLSLRNWNLQREATHVALEIVNEPLDSYNSNLEIGYMWQGRLGALR